MISGALEVLVYGVDDLPYLKPTYGSKPCPIWDDPDYIDCDEEESGFLDPMSRAGSDPGLSHGDEREDASKNSSQSLSEESHGDGEGLDDDVFEGLEVSVDEKSDQDEASEGSIFEGEGKSVPTSLIVGEFFGNWPHEPRYCANVWSEEGHEAGESPTSAPEPRRYSHLPFNRLSCCLSWLNAGCVLTGHYYRNLSRLRNHSDDGSLFMPRQVFTARDPVEFHEKEHREIVCKWPNCLRVYIFAQ